MEHRLETLEVYLMAEASSDPIWNLIQQWDSFKQETIGKQLARAADSISANIAKGYGRFYYKETKAWLSIRSSAQHNPKPKPSPSPNS